MNADLDGKVVFLGLDVDPLPAEAGKDLKLTQYWKVVTAPGDGWKTFTHVEGPGKQNYVNADHTPIQGKYPVSAWKAGDIIRDIHTVKLPDAWSYPGGRGLRRPLAGFHPDADQERGARQRGAGAGGVDPGARGGGRGDPQALRGALRGQGAQARREARRCGLGGGAVDRAVRNTMTGAPVQPMMNTEAKLLWDKKNLYVGFDNTDDDVWTDLTKRDDKLWTEEADELMIDADGNGRTYIELQVAPNANIFDTYLPSPRRYEDTVDPKLKPFSWNSKMIAKVHVDGTLNKRDDQDKGWTTELAIPLEDVKGMDDKSAVRLPPEPGDVWRINMYRMDLPKGKPQQAAGWSAPLVGDFHALGAVRRAGVRRRRREDRAAGRDRSQAGGARKLAGPAVAPAPDRKAPAAARGGDLHDKK